MVLSKFWQHLYKGGHTAGEESLPYSSIQLEVVIPCIIRQKSLLKISKPRQKWRHMVKQMLMAWVPAQMLLWFPVICQKLTMETFYFWCGGAKIREAYFTPLHAWKSGLNWRCIKVQVIWNRVLFFSFLSPCI